MKKIWIIYDVPQYENNKWFAKRLKDGLVGAGEAEVVMKEDLKEPFELPDVAVVRTIDPGLSEYLESRGVRVVNPARVAKICNDKRLSYELAKSCGIPFQEYYDLEAGKEVPPEAFPVVVKTVSGHGGKGVVLCGNLYDLSKAGDFFKNDKIIAQKLSGDGKSGRDMRVYVLGGKIYKAVLRVSKKDFRSNYSLGGKALPAELKPEEEAMVYKIVEGLGPNDLIGVDFLVTDEGLLFNEIEDVVGMRMLYSVYGIDAAAVFADYIRSLL